MRLKEKWDSAKAKSSILNDKLKRYPVKEDISKILEGLSFKSVPFQLDNWELLTRHSDYDEFAAIYTQDRRRVFLVAGKCKSDDDLESDLESLTRFGLEEGWVSKNFREGYISTALFGGGFLALTFGLLFYYSNNGGEFAINIDNFIKNINPSDTVEIATGILSFGLILYYAVDTAARKGLNLFYGSRLSDDALDYKYGNDAYGWLRDKLIAISGKPSEQELLKSINQTGDNWS